MTSLLKQYLRELPEPVIPYERYEKLMEAAKILKNQGDASDIVKGELLRLPRNNYNLLR